MTASEPASGTPSPAPDDLRARLEEDPAGLLFDLLVHVPIGIAVSTRDLLPQLIERGRKRVDQQVTTARMIGSFVVPIARRKGEAYLRSRFASSPATPAVAVPDGAPTPAPTASAPPTSVPSGGPVDPGPPPAPSSAGALPIEGYDGLPASAVVPLLGGLDPAERALVAAHERAHRARRTILARIEQLDGADTPPR